LEVILRDNVSFSDFDVEHVFPSIGRRSMVLNARKIWREGNNSALILLAIQDVTKRKQAEAECEQLIRELRRSNEDLGQFAYVASHDLRSPLNTVLQFTQLLVRRHGEKLGREANDYLQIVQESVTRMEALITALLRYSHYSEADQNLVEPAAAAAACETAMANLQGVIEESGARITWDDLPEIRIDSTQLLQIFQNLIANAIHYRGDAVPEVHISTKLQDARWLFSVSDNGPGIAAKYHDRIFEPFKRLHGPERPGSGIGLALCRKIVERSGGRIWVDSEEGKGSTFRFSLPQA
jgi:light-regulated signal transduction histidine kinase (bacteriophytochrome)